MQIADKWTIIDIHEADLHKSTKQYLDMRRKYWRDEDGPEHLYSTAILSDYKEFYKDQVTLRVEEELKEIERLAAENDAFYFRIIYL